MVDGLDNHLQNTINAVVEQFNAEYREFRGQPSLFIQANVLLGAGQLLRDKFSFNMLMDVTAVDYLPEEPRFHVVYQLYSMEKNLRLSLRVPVDGEEPHLHTIEGVFPGANWYEREVMDMFGIIFDQHSDPRRIIMPADWQGHPLRKDYPLGYEEVEFTFNFDEIDVRKPKGKEM